MSNFGNLVKATGNEEERFYNTMHELEMAPLIVHDKFARATIGMNMNTDINGDLIVDFIECTDVFKDESSRSFSCGFSLSQGTKETPRDLSRAQETGTKILGGFPVREVSYGDIDSDGDLDIAIQISTGAVYVFHLSTEKEQTKQPTPAP